MAGLDDDPEIRFLEQCEKDFYNAYMAAKKAVTDAKIARCGIAIGDIVRSTSGRTAGQLFRVTNIDPNYGRKGWVKASPKKLDGTFGKTMRALFSDWEKVAAADGIPTET